MQKWEYLVVDVESIGHVKYINGEDVEKGLYTNKNLFGGGTTQSMQTPRLYEYLEAAGKNGWEICGTLPYENPYYKILLKRPLE